MITGIVVLSFLCVVFLFLCLCMITYIAFLNKEIKDKNKKIQLDELNKTMKGMGDDYRALKSVASNKREIKAKAKAYDVFLEASKAGDLSMQVSGITLKAAYCAATRQIKKMKG